MTKQQILFDEYLKATQDPIIEEEDTSDPLKDYMASISESKLEPELDTKAPNALKSYDSQSRLKVPFIPATIKNPYSSNYEEDDL